MKKNGALIPYVKPYAKVNGVLEPLWYDGGFLPIWDEEEGD
jgi:chitinase